MIQKILHCADIHIKNKLSTHSEIIDVFSDFIKKAKMESPDRIVIVGDLFDNYIEVNNEAKIIAGDFLNKLSEIAPIRITQGNHDIRKSSINRTDSILTVVNLINNPNIIYYKETNFYEDENVIFAVWHHIDKESPWVKIPHDRKNDKIYIDLFHDPINGCVSEIRRKIDSKNGINLSDFKGDFAFLGDIHLYQEYTKDDKIFSVYPSSVWETKYSEGDGDFHGFVIWDIINRKLNKIKVENKYSHHNIKIDINFNYSNPILDINKDNLTEFSRLKIIWSDYESKMTKENENSIRKYIKNYFPEIYLVIFDRKPQLKNKLDKIDDDNIKNITNFEVQKDVLKKHLKENKISEDIIEGILELDNEINNLLNKEDCLSYDIKINKLIINNFRSFGDNVILDLNDKDGIYQILGSNASGKSTILYFIMYMLYGKTPSTSKKEKFNDNKFINNRRDLDFCEGELFLQINSESYLIKKKTERKWNRNNTELSSCSTIVEYFKLDENGSILNDENEERKTSMQKTIEQSIGSYEDFIRKVFTDSDSLNYLLSNDKADFIDNILYDIGLDIFDKKLEAYKSYKKNNYKKEERVVIDLEKTQTTISEYENNIEIHKNDIKDYKNTLSNINSDINVFLSKKDEELKNIITIDEKIKSFDLNKSENSITILKKDKNDKESSLILLENEISSLNNKYKDNELEDLKKELDNLKNILSEKKDNINKTKLNILEKTNFKNNLENNISILENEIVNLRTNYEKELSNIDKEIENTEKSILELEHSKECPTCKRVYDSQEVIITIEENIKKKKESIDNLLNSKKIENNPELKNIKDKAASNKSKIEDIKKEILSLESVISELNILKSEDEKFLLSKKDSFEILNNNISNIEKDLSHKEKLVSQKNNIPLLLENIELKILNENRLIEEYKKNIKNIEKNEITKNNIKVIEENLKEILVKKDNINSKINHIENVLISELSNKIKTLLEKIDLWKIQEKKDLINKLYLDSIHRDGLPTILLRKLLPNINNELKSLLSEMNFTLWFDENINLKMTNNSFNISQNVLDGSGMERTFIAFVLKLTLMKISNKSKFNLLLFDEVSSKLDTNNVEYFKELLHKTKSYIDKIMVIDHYNDFIPDFIIEVKPDENGISHLQISE